MAYRKRNYYEASHSKWDSSDEKSDTEKCCSTSSKKCLLAKIKSEPAQSGSSGKFVKDLSPDNNYSASSCTCRYDRYASSYKFIKLLGKGAFGLVYKAKDINNSEIYALKLICKSLVEEIPISVLREILIMFKVDHPNVVKAREVLFNEDLSQIYIAMEHVSFQLLDFMHEKKLPFSEGEVKFLIWQLLCGTAHLHGWLFMHRDLKPSNLLLTADGNLKICDFGLARKLHCGKTSYTPVVVTLWYRSPELLLGCTEYSTNIDMWSVGCIFSEFLTMVPLLPGTSAVGQLKEIVKCLGTPNDQIWPGMNELPGMDKLALEKQPYNYLRKRIGRKITDSTFDLINKLLVYDPDQRLSAKDALAHDSFLELPEMENIQSLHSP